MKCVSYFDRLERKSGFQKSGDPMKTIYEYRIEDGKKILVPVGKEDIQEEIESYAKSCDITNILNRFMNGEIDLLNARQGFYGDVRNMPSNYAEYFARVKDAEKMFKKMPKEIRQAFDNSAEKFFTMDPKEVNNIIRSFQNENENSTSVSASGKESEVSVNAE